MPSKMLAEIRMISGCRDNQTSADVSNVGRFRLEAGKAGGACTSSLLNVVYADKHITNEHITFKDVLLKIRSILLEKKFRQVPQLSSSRPLDVDMEFDISHPDYEGVNRAVMIGVNYIGQSGELRGCHNDVLNMREYLMDVHKFDQRNIELLMDDGVHTNPTKKNIIKAFRDIVDVSKHGDKVYIHFSGHGLSVTDNDGDEEDSCDETIVPVDYEKSGLIRDDDIMSNLVLPMRKGVFMTVLMDCCHSGTILDLPYNFKVDANDILLGEQPRNSSPMTSLFQSCKDGMKCSCNIS